MSVDDLPRCLKCHFPFSLARSKLGHRLCKRCGNEEAAAVKHAIGQPYNKGPYMVVTNRKQLKSLARKAEND